MTDMKRFAYPREAFRAAAASGCLWAIIGLLVAALARPGVADAVRFALGGMLAAPLIGALMGYVSAWFIHFRPIGRSLIALGSLYAAATLFVLFSMTLGMVTFDTARTPSPLMLAATAAMTAYAGLMMTGAVIVLWPLALLNHHWVGDRWASLQER